MNPFTTARDEHMTRVFIKDVPLSVGDDLIRATLEGKKYKIRGDITRQQLRVGGQLTNCLNGDRIVYIDPPTQPLPRFLAVGNVFRARAFHAGQPERQGTGTVTCSTCLESGHHASTCQNLVKCRSCKQSGHLSHSCPANVSQQRHGNADNGTPISIEKLAGESPADNTPREAGETLRNAARVPQDDDNARVRKVRQTGISDFLRAKDTDAGSASQEQDSRERASDAESASHYSTTHDDGEEQFSSCNSSSSEEEQSPLSPEMIRDTFPSEEYRGLQEL